MIAHDSTLNHPNYNSLLLLDYVVSALKADTTVNPKNPLHRPQFQWSRQGASAVIVITAIQPYLRIKSDHAFLALQFWEHI
jgi:hypothetical protein